MTITPEMTEDIVFDLVISENKFPVDFNLAWRWLEFTNKRNAKRSITTCGFVENTDFRVFDPNEQNSTVETKTSIRGRKEGRRGEEIWLTAECFKSWGMMASTRKG
jgi:anti-repressor protein